jgi:predicted phosphodiesterase
MRYAIFSDIHNHTTALSTVLSHASQQAIDHYFCLGDIGFDDCADLIRQANMPTVFGNWEVSNWRYFFSPTNQAWALNLPPIHKEAHFWLTHAAPLWPETLATLADLNAHLHDVSLAQLFPYLHFESVGLWKTIVALTEANIPLMFHGHTHRQIAWRFTADNHLQKLPHQTITLRPGDTLVVGVGSVGRPEDGPGAAYVIYDDELRQIQMIRVQEP